MGPQLVRGAPEILEFEPLEKSGPNAPFDSQLVGFGLVLCPWPFSNPPNEPRRPEPRRAEESPRETRRTQENPGNSQNSPGEPRSAQENRREPRKAQESPRERKKAQKNAELADGPPACSGARKYSNLNLSKKVVQTQLLTLNWWASASFCASGLFPASRTCPEDQNPEEPRRSQENPGRTPPDPRERKRA